MALIDKSKYRVTSNRMEKWNNAYPENDEQMAQMELDKKADETSQLVQITDPRLYAMVAKVHERDGGGFEDAIARLFLRQDKEAMVWKGYLSPAMVWCFIKEKEIRMRHGSLTCTRVFTHHCIICKTYFKPCMFSIRDKKDPDNAWCQWCKVDGDGLHCIKLFTIDQHLYCNTKEKTCRPDGWRNLKEVRSWWSDEEWDLVKVEELGKERLKEDKEVDGLASEMEMMAVE